MGVKNLWKLLKESYCTEKRMDWNTQNGSIWAVDLSFWIVEASTAMQHVKFHDPTFRPHLRNLFFRIKHLLSLGILLIFIFDGAPPPQKFLTLQRRGVLGNINRRNKKKKYSQSVFGRQCKECKQLLNILGIPYIDLKYGEAEAFCSKLNKYGIVNAVLTPDGDSFLFGANKIFTQYQKTNIMINCCNINKSDLDQRKFIALGLLLGSDYCDGVKGIGHKRAIKLLQTAMNEYGINNNNDNNDWLFHIIKWCQMNENEINKLFEKNTNRKKNKIIEKFINQIRETYDDMDYLMDIINAYLNPEFDKKDEEKLFNNKWLKWKCPDFVEMIMFSDQYLQMELKNIIQHTLDIVFDLFLFGFIDKNDIHKFEMINIIKSRIRSKIPMYSIQWKCNDDEINKEIFENQELNGIKCEGLHFADAVQQLHPDLVSKYEIELNEKKKKNKKPKQVKTKKKNVVNSNEKQIESMDKNSKKKKKKYGNYNKKYYSQKVDWKEPIDTNKKALIYSQNVDELEELNQMLSQVSVQNSKKKKKQEIEINIDEQQQNENINDLNVAEPKKQKKKHVFKCKKSMQSRGINRCLLSDSSDDGDCSENVNMSLKDRITKKRKYKKKTVANKNTETPPEPKQKKLKHIQNDNDINNNHHNNNNDIGWKCKICTFFNVTNAKKRLCSMCGTENKNDDDLSPLMDKLKISESVQLGWDCNQCTLRNDSKDKKCKLCGYNNLNTNDILGKDEESDGIWDLTEYSNKKKKSNSKSKVSAKTSIHNTSTSTVEWKCFICKKKIPIHIYVCPNCG